jgi:hypothetical protein
MGKAALKKALKLALDQHQNNWFEISQVEMLVYDEKEI